MLQIISHLYVQIKNYFYSRDQLSVYGKDSYALITGASDGLGKATSFVLASYGFNIILLARNKTKLDNVKTDILKKHPKVKIETFLIDLTQLFVTNQFKQRADFANGFDLSLIINNLGILLSNPMKYLDIASKNPKGRTAVISVNTVSYVLTHFTSPTKFQNGQVGLASLTGVLFPALYIIPFLIFTDPKNPSTTTSHRV